ncbi:hypothetical protein HDV57DRAFT_16959 [Trichoderma longibrachiatum]
MRAMPVGCLGGTRVLGMYIQAQEVHAPGTCAFDRGLRFLQERELVQSTYLGTLCICICVCDFQSCRQLRAAMRSSQQ